MIQCGLNILQWSLTNVGVNVVSEPYFVSAEVINQTL